MAEQRGASATIEGTKGTTEGVYVYSIVELSDPRTFGKIGIGGRGDEVHTVHCRVRRRTTATAGAASSPC